METTSARLQSSHPGASEEALAPSPVLAQGTVLGDSYEILELVATGSMGDVYSASHKRLPGRLAIKVLRPGLASHEEMFTRFCREAAIMSQLRHPHVVQVFDFNHMADGTPYLVMEYLEGGDLGTELESRGALPLLEGLGIVRQIAGALTAAHAVGIVHRDLKPENVMVQRAAGYEAFVKVLDFGISSAPWAPRLTLGSSLMGTPNYMAPEHALGRMDDLDPRGDQFALAAVSYEILAGRQAFSGETPLAVLYQVVNAQPEPLANLVPWPAAGVEQVLLRGLAKKKEDRFDTVLDFAQALEAAAAPPAAEAFDAGAFDVEGPELGLEATPAYVEVALCTAEGDDDVVLLPAQDGPPAYAELSLNGDEDDGHPMHFPARALHARAALAS